MRAPLDMIETLQDVAGNTPNTGFARVHYPCRRSRRCRRPPAGTSLLCALGAFAGVYPPTKQDAAVAGCVLGGCVVLPQRSTCHQGRFVGMGRRRPRRPANRSIPNVTCQSERSPAQPDIQPMCSSHAQFLALHVVGTRCAGASKRAVAACRSWGGRAPAGGPAVQASMPAVSSRAALAALLPDLHCALTLLPGGRALWPQSLRCSHMCLQ